MKNLRKKFTAAEIRDLIIVILGVALILAYPDLKSKFFLYLIIISISLFLRQVFHKLMANKLECMTTFRLWPLGVTLGLVTLLLKTTFGFFFAALGFIEIVPYKFGRWGIKLIKMTPRDYAHIALAGLSVNLFFLIFFGIWYSINPVEIFKTISIINGILAFFSSLPLPSLEGGHIFTASIWTWVSVMSIILFFFAFILI